GDRVADGREDLRKMHDMFELGHVAHGAKISVIAILLPSPGVAPGRLKMAIGGGADPDICPGGRNHQSFYARKTPPVGQGRAVCAIIDERVASPGARDSRALVADIAKSGRFRVISRFS